MPGLVLKYHVGQRWEQNAPGNLPDVSVSPLVVVLDVFCFVRGGSFSLTSNPRFLAIGYCRNENVEKKKSYNKYLERQ